MHRISIALALLIGALAMVAAVAAADDEEANVEEVSILDECDPATFNAVGFGVICDPGFDGDVSFAEASAALPEGHEDWLFDPDETDIDVGDTVRAVNEGGEVHTFTEVVAFGGGFIPDLNNPTGSASVTECANPAVLTFLPPGASLDVTGLSVGTHRFECCIHPWMRTVIEVEDD